MSHGEAVPGDADLLDEPYRPEIVSSDTVYSGAVWNIRRDQFRYNDATITREYVDHTGAVAVLALDEHDRVLLIRQYRHPVRSRDWEIPAGLLDIAGEDPWRAAQRELAEETDLQAEQWHVLADVCTSPGGSDEAIRIYLARSVSATDQVFEREEEEADIQKRWVPLDDAVTAALEGRVHNAPLLIALLAAHASRATGWRSLREADSPWSSHPGLNKAG